MKLGRHRAWEDWELDIYEKKWRIGTLERFISDSALHSGQRSADLPKMRREQIWDGHLHFVQQKTGKNMALRIHTSWLESMDAYLTTHKHPPLSPAKKAGQFTNSRWRRSSGMQNGPQEFLMIVYCMVFAKRPLAFWQSLE